MSSSKTDKHISDLNAVTSITGSLGFRLIWIWKEKEVLRTHLCCYWPLQRQVGTGRGLFELTRVGSKYTTSSEREIADDMVMIWRGCKSFSCQWYRCHASVRRSVHNSIISRQILGSDPSWSSKYSSVDIICFYGKTWSLVTPDERNSAWDLSHKDRFGDLGNVRIIAGL